MNDLDWLAVNVPASDHYEKIIKAVESPCGFLFRTNAYLSGYTKAAVDARREEMINRPKFEDHPDADYFAQDRDGEWFSYKGKPEAGPNFFEGLKTKRINQGLVIGDWKDALIKRPAIDPVVAANVEAFNSVDFAMTLIGADKMKEWENGLPRSGQCCEYIADTNAHIERWEECAFIGRVGGEDFVLSILDDKVDRMKAIDPVRRFRPIRTEEDKAVDELVNIIEVNSHSIKDTARAIIKAGYKK